MLITTNGQFENITSFVNDYRVAAYLSTQASMRSCERTIVYQVFYKIA